MTRSKADEAAHEKWTPFPADLYDWDPWVDMRSVERDLWWSLVASRHATRWPPGLWLGSAALMADSARMGLEDVEIALARLRAKGLFEFDEGRLSIGRLTVLPPTETWRPHSPNAIFGWWGGFRNLPTCAIRDSHIPTLKALVVRPTAKHLEAWDATFGRVKALARIPSGNGSPNGSRSSDFAGGETVPGTVTDLGSRMSSSSSDPEIPPPRLQRDLVQGAGEQPRQLAVDNLGRECVLVNGVPVSSELAAQPGMTDLLGKAFARYGPLPAAVESETNLARRFK